jgi:hypothetical protein
MTYGKALTYVFENCDLPTEVREKLEALSASIAKKNSAERKPTAKQIENAGVKSAIVEWMTEGCIYSCAEVAKECPACEDLSSARVSALLTQLTESGLLNKVVEKRKNYYSLA